MLRYHAKRAGLSDEAYIRHLIMGRIPREQPPVAYYEFLRELHAIGNRMNQIAARANATGFFLAEEYAARADELHEQILKIRAAVEQPERTI